MANRALSVQALRIRASGEKECVCCTHDKFHTVPIFPARFIFLCGHCWQTYRKDCLCPDATCEHTPMKCQRLATP